MNKRIKTFIIDALFAGIVVGLLYFVRWKSKAYIEQLMSFVPELSSIQQGLADKTADLNSVNSLVSTMGSIENKFLILNAVVLPLGIFIFWIVFQGINFYLMEKVGWKRFVLFSIWPFAMFYAFAYFLINTIATLSDLHIILTSVFGLLWLDSIYWVPMYLLRKKEKGVSMTKFGWKNWKKLTLPYLILIINTFLIVLNITLIYVFLEGEASIILPAIVLALLLVGLNFSRSWYLNTIKRIK